MNVMRSRWIAQLLRPHVNQLVVCDARHNRLISSHPNKHDRRDAFALTRLFRLATGWNGRSPEIPTLR
jgi:hypothetical protein